jgi:UDP-MurNAc hydroxylase
MVDIEWINHAGFVTRHRDVALACDPWLDGAAFNEGWSLISPTRFKPDDFANVTHIWFSHEHPDHFSPKNVHEVPAEMRPRINVLFQKTRDAKVIRFCRDLGFKTVELESAVPYKLAPDFTVSCYRHSGADRTGTVDSFLLMQAEKTRLLNLNDYIPDNIAELRAIKECCGDLTVLFTQFSYANWVGNPGADEFKRNAAEKKIDSLQQQITILRPQFVVPFASFVIFSNSENYHMNSHVNEIGKIYRIIARTDTMPVVLYPGERWTVGERHDCQLALSQYGVDMQRALEGPPQYSVAKVPSEQLLAEGEKFRQKMLSSHAALILHLIPGTTIWIVDYQKGFSFSYRHGLREHPDISQNRCDISAVSGAISHCFTAAWGADTLFVNGCFTSPANKHGRFFSCMAPARYSNAGIKLDLAITAGAIGRKVQGILSKPVRFSRQLDTKLSDSSSGLR